MKEDYNSYSKKLEVQRSSWQDGLFVLPSDVLRPLCRKHTMTVFQQVFLRNLCPFFLSSHLFESQIKTSLSHLAVYIEDIPMSNGDKIYLTVVNLSGKEFERCKQNTRIFQEICSSTYQRFYDCMWCHRSWLGQTATFLFKNRPIDLITEIEIQKLRKNIPGFSTLSNGQILELISYYSQQLHGRSKKEIRQNYRQIVDRLWLKAGSSDPEYTLQRYHQLLMIYPKC